MKQKDIVPQFKNESEEDKFWENHSVLDYPERFKRVNINFSNLKFTENK